MVACKTETTQTRLKIIISFLKIIIKKKQKHILLVYVGNLAGVQRRTPSVVLN